MNKNKTAFKCFTGIVPEMKDFSAVKYLHLEK